MVGTKGNFLLTPLRYAVGGRAYTAAVETISFARGIPAPECLPVAELADCAKEALERDGDVAPLVRQHARLRAAARVDRRAPRCRAGARAVVTNGSLQALPLRARLAPRRPRARRAADVRPAAEDPRRGSAPRSTRCALDEEGLDVDALERALAAAPEPAFVYTIPTFQNPSGRRCARAAARGSPSSRASTTCWCSRTTRTASCGSRASRCRRCSSSRAASTSSYSSSFSKTIAPGPARRLLRSLPGGARRALEAARRVDVHHAGAARPGDGLRVPPARALRAEPRARARAAAGAARRDARGARARARRTTLAGAGPRAATSSGSTCRAASTRPSCSRARLRPGVTFVPGADFRRPGRLGSGSRSASCRRTRSTRACDALRS